MKKNAHKKARKPRSRRAQPVAGVPRSGNGARSAIAGRAGRVTSGRSAAVRTAVLPAAMTFARTATTRLVAPVASRAAAIAGVVRREDRELVTLLLAPFLILAATIAANQSFQIGRQLRALIARPVAPQIIPAAQTEARPVRAMVPGLAAIGPARADMTLVRSGGAPSGHASRPEARPVSWVSVPDDIALPVMSSTSRQVALVGERGSIAKAARAPLLGQVRPERIAPERAAALPAIAPTPSQPASRDRRPFTLATLPPGDFASLFAREDGSLTGQRASLDQRCEIETASGVASRHLPRAAVAAAAASVPAAASAEAFGRRLAEAALTQIDQFTIYDDAYRSISYPGGDVPRLYGVCTDVIIRAYRALGVDLQVAVQRARVGSGDRNIDHRRTETLRRFFQKAGQSLPVTSFAEDYLPGDVVTYARPQNTGSASRSHIALVTHVIAPSGRPMIVHNRGWGPQLEDGLFVDRITGHYRYAASATELAALTDAARGPAPPPVRVIQVRGDVRVLLKPIGERRPAADRPAQLSPVPRRALKQARSADYQRPRNTAHR